MSKVFSRKQFSNYLGEQRAIDDIISQFVPDPSPTPTPSPQPVTPTPSVTPSISVSPTPTISVTPSISPSSTSTPTPTPSITVSPTPSITPTLTPTPSPAPMYSFSGAVYDASSNSGACASSTVVSNLWGFNAVWTGNTGLFTDNIGTIPAPAGFYNYNDVVLEVIAGGGIPNPPYECPPVTPTPTPTNTPTPSPPAFDTDAALYLNDVLNQGGSLDATISAATNTLFTDLKSNGLYSKLDVLYLMLGSTSGSTALNAIRTGSTYDITWNNVADLSFGISGATGGGSGYGNTNYNPNGIISATDFSFGIYHTEANFGAANGETYTWGSFDGTYITQNWANNGTQRFGMYGYTTASNLNTPIGTQGYGGSWIGTSDSFGVKTLYHNISSNNSSLTGTTSGIVSGSAQLPNQPYYLFTLNLIGSPYSPNYFNGRIQSLYIGDYLTPSEVNTIDGLINTFHTTLGRNIY